MSLFTLTLISLSLAMDAFAVSISAGLSNHHIRRGQAIIIASVFAFFQTIMPIIGYTSGVFIRDIVALWSGPIAFILLAGLGYNMIRSAMQIDESDTKIDYFAWKTLTVLGIATSIDALIIGVSFAFFENHILLSSALIGSITFLMCITGVYIGSRFGNISPKKAEIGGGLILMGIGIKILFDYFLGV